MGQGWEVEGGKKLCEEERSGYMGMEGPRQTPSAQFCPLTSPRVRRGPSRGVCSAKVHWPSFLQEWYVIGIFVISPLIHSFEGGTWILFLYSSHD